MTTILTQGVTYTNNYNTNSETAAINGKLGYLLFDPNIKVKLDDCTSKEVKANSNKCSSVAVRYGLAVFGSANGTFNSPVKKGSAPTTSALKSGFDFVTNIMFVSKYLQNIYINITPYYQTDFAGTANIYGNVLSFSPYNSFLHLGGDPTSTTSTSKYFHANKIFWQFSPEFISAHVNTVGTTFLQNGSRFLGGVNVFGNFNFDIYKINKITFKVGREFLVDALSDKTVNYFLTSLSVPLASSSSDNPGKSVTPKLTFEYARGTDKDTLYSTNQFKISLSGTY